MIISSIRQFFDLTTDQQNEILKGIQTKEKLFAWLERRKGKDVTAGWVPCSKCAGKGEIYLEARDNNGVHASQIHLCPRKIWFDVKGHANDYPTTVGGKLQLIFDHGSYLHDMLQNYGLRGAWKSGPDCEYLPEVKLLPTEDQCKAQGTFPFPLAIKYKIKSSVDALIRKYHLDTSFGPVEIDIVHEYKSIGSNGFAMVQKDGPKAVHKKQATIYQAVLDCPVVVYIYYNKDKDDIECFAQRFDGYVWGEVEDKIQEILFTLDSDDANEAVPLSKCAATYNKEECTGGLYSSACNYYGKLCFPDAVPVEKVTKRGRPKKNVHTPVQ